MTDNNIFITSNNQSGGITAHTVNLGQIARALTPDLEQSLLRQFPSKDTKIVIVAIMGDGEALSFAHQIDVFLKNNNYSNVDGVNQSLFSQPVMGQYIEKKSENEYQITIGTNQV